MREENIPVLEIYSDALIDAAERQGALDAAFEEAAVVLTVLKEHPSVLVLLERPAIRKDEKQAFLRRVFEGRLSPLMLNLTLMLVEKNRGGLWMGLMEYFIQEIEERRGIHGAEVRTAIELPSGERDRLTETLERFFGKRFRIRFNADPHLIAGVLFRFGDVMIDTTIRDYLKEIRERLEAVKIA
ncbi:ATP synthase F1 subunit delta [Candidatus Sumerlaeota bacterium]|nr:ATP synthase F1 subunit delta [Candidatus Sumerlaeota bacterium]